MAHLLKNLQNNVISIITGMLLMGNAFAVQINGNEPVSTTYLGNDAIGKHDATAYHTKKHVIKGEKQFVYEWKGAKWYFATQEQRDLFALNPEKYSPAYNGFCSNALTLGEGLIRTNGKIWHIFGDQLYLFYAERGRVRWVEGDYFSLKSQADKAWQAELADLRQK